MIRKLNVMLPKILDDTKSNWNDIKIERNDTKVPDVPKVYKIIQNLHITRKLKVMISKLPDDTKSVWNYNKIEIHDTKIKENVTKSSRRCQNCKKGYQKWK